MRECKKDYMNVRESMDSVWGWPARVGFEMGVKGSRLGSRLQGLSLCLPFGVVSTTPHPCAAPHTQLGLPSVTFVLLLFFLPHFPCH